MLTTIRDFITENITGQSSIATNGILLLLTALAAIAFYYITRFLLAMLEKLIMRNATPNPLITEDYFNITIGINFNEMWFRQSKIY